jgi:hypothetical protein
MRTRAIDCNVTPVRLYTPVHFSWARSSCNWDVLTETSSAIVALISSSVAAFRLPALPDLANCLMLSSSRPPAYGYKYENTFRDVHVFTTTGLTDKINLYNRRGYKIIPEKKKQTLQKHKKYTSKPNVSVKGC